MEPVSGQLLLNFDASEIRRLRSFPRKSDAANQAQIRYKRREAETWFEKGLDRALAGAAGALKEREHDDRDEEIARLKSKVGEITMDNELLDAKIAALEGKRPLAHRRSRR